MAPAVALSTVSNRSSHSYVISDAILDSGSTDNVFPEELSGQLSNVYKYRNNGSLHIGDDSVLETVGYGDYGLLRGVILCIGLVLPLVSVNHLTKTLGYHIFFSVNRAFIAKVLRETNENTTLRVLTTATIDLRTGLYHMDNMLDFLRLEPDLNAPTFSITPMRIPKIPKAFPNFALNEGGDLTENAMENPKEIITATQNVPVIKPVRPNLSQLQLQSGSAKSNSKSLRGGFSSMQWLHLRLGHAGRDAILKMVKDGSINGFGVSFEELTNDNTWFHCNSCEHGRMHSFPIPASITRRDYGIFEFITSDFIPFRKSSTRGYVGSYIYGDRASGKLWSYLVKSKDEWLATYQLLQAEFGPNMNANSMKTIVLQTDFDSVVHSTDFTKYLLESGAHLFNSSPYKHAQNLIERFIQTLKNMVRTNMHFNGAPGNYWCYALQYSIDTYNMLASKSKTITRNEIFSSEKVDISKCVPFYARGWSHIDDIERAYLDKNPKFPRNDKALDVRMLGYTDPHRLEDKTKALVYIKNSYLVESKFYTKDIVRHDCRFQVNSDREPDLLHADSSMRVDAPNLEEIEKEEVELQKEYDEYLDVALDTDLNYSASVITDGISVMHNGDFNDIAPWFIDEELDHHIATMARRNSSVTSSSNLAVSESSTVLTDLPVLARKRRRLDARRQNQKRRNKHLAKRLAAKHLKANPPPLSTYSMISENGNLKISPPTSPINLLHSRNKAKLKTPTKLELNQYVLTLTTFEDGRENISIAMGESLSHLEKPSPTKSVPNEVLVQPTSIPDALGGETPLQWIFAALDELQNLDLRKTWEIIPQGEDQGLNPIKSKFAFRLTTKPDDFLKFRARLVACGYSQVPGKDFDLTFSPTAKYKSLVIVLHLAAIFGWELAGIDVSNAYIEADIDKLIHMTLPKDLFRWKDGSPIIVKLKKSLYGLKQAGELWNKLLNEKITDFGFTRCMHDKCVYTLRNIETGEVTIIVCYVDDVLFIGNSPTVIESAINYLISQFTRLTNMGSVTRYLGVDIKRDLGNNTLELSQKPYIVKFLKDRVNPMSSVKHIPLPETVDYSKKGDNTLPPILDSVGTLRYLADRTRPDLLTAVGSIGSAASNPTVDHVRGVDHIGRYLEATKDKCVTLGGRDTRVNLFGYSDASHLPHGDSKPRLGYCFYLNLESGAIYARSHFATNVSHSSCESEIFALDETIREAIYLRGFLAELGFEQDHATVIYTDSTSAKTLIDLFNVGSSSAHIIMRLNYLHEQVLLGNIELKYIQTDLQVADILTKLLSVPKHEKFTEFLLRGHNGIEPSSSPKVPKTPKPKSMFKINRTTGRFQHKCARK